MFETCKDFHPEGMSSATIGAMLDELSNAMKAGHFDKVDELLASYPDAYITQGDPGAPTALMRYTFPAREKLSNWRPFVEKVHRLLEPVHPGLTEGLLRD